MSPSWTSAHPIGYVVILQAMFSAMILLALSNAGLSAPTTRPARHAETINYDQDYIASGANVHYTPDQAAGSFSVSYDTSADFVVGLGWEKGDSKPISYKGTFSATGVGLLSVYGWSTDPLVEYYIMETSTGYPQEGTRKGSLTSDGATYDIWEHQQVDQPSIQGTTTFKQYISIRQSPRTSGTVTVENHFAAWAAVGMNLGTLNYQVIAIESWSGRGSGEISLSKGSGSTDSSIISLTTSSTTDSAPSTPSDDTVALYGQCGGIEYTGPTTCATGSTCTVYNSYYSQCQA